MKKENTSAKNRLRQIRENRERIADLELLMKEIHMNFDSGGSGIDYAKPRVQASPINQMEDAAWKMLDDRKKMQYQVMKLKLENKEMLEQIMGLSNYLYRRVLIKEFSEGKSLERISAELNYSYSHICRINGEALKAYADKYMRDKR